MSMSGLPAKPAVKIVRFTPLSLRKEYDDESKDFGMLTWSIRMGYPRITVFTSNNTKTDGKFDYDKMITAPFDYVTMGILLKRFQEVVASKEEVKFTVECYNPKFVNRVKTDEIALQAKVTIGKDADGVVFIAAIEDNKRKVRFDLLPSMIWHKYYDKNGDQITDRRLLSEMYAFSYLKLLNSLLDAEAAKDMLSEKDVVEKTSVKPANSDDLSDLL